MIWLVLLTWLWYHEWKLWYKSEHNFFPLFSKKFWLNTMQTFVNVQLFPNLPFGCSVFREEEKKSFCWPGDLFHCNRRLAAALKSRTPVHKRLEVQHWDSLDSSQQACQPWLPVLFRDIQLLCFSKGSPCLWDSSWRSLLIQFKLWENFTLLQKSRAGVSGLLY